jgi:Sec-independent protein translocase protein TatA
MNLFKIVGEIVVVYFLYKLIFDFIIPAYKGVKQVKATMSDMQSKMQEQQKQYTNQQKPTEPIRKTETVAKDDYIDYEEVK